MRIERLDLTRYGHFTDRQLAFPAPAPGEPDLHVVFGPNEAGKSTIFAAWLDLLYGIPTRSPFNFLHAYSTLQIGAAISSANGPLDLVRTKALQNSLKDPTGQPLPEALLSAALGGLDREDYRMMFSLDDQTLETGGESILSSKGDFGQLLFSASSGLAGLTDLLSRTGQAADDFFRSGKRSGGLVDLKTELATLTADRQRLDVAAGDHARLVTAERAAVAAHQGRESELAATNARLSAVQRILDAQPVLARLRAAEADLAALPDLPAPPPGWNEELVELARDHATTTALIVSATEALAETDAALAGLLPDAEALALAPRLEAAAPLKSAFDTANTDLPKRRAEASDAGQAIAAVLHRLGRPGTAAHDLLPDQAIRSGLRAHLADRSGLVERLRSARTEAETARQTLAVLREKTGESPAELPDAAALAAHLVRLRANDPAQALRHARDAHETARATLDARLAQLTPWRGSGAELAALPVPPRDRQDDLKHRIDAATEAARTTSQEAARLRTSVADRAASLAVRAPNASGLTATEADRLRGQREALWSRHRETLTVESADAFEAALRADDRATAHLAEIAADRLLAAEAEAALAAEGATLATAEAAEAAAGKHLLQTRDALRDLIRAISPVLPPDLDPAGLRDWLAIRTEAVEAHVVVTRAEAAHAHAEADLTAARQALAATLGETDAALLYDTLLARAEAAHAAAGAIAALRQAAAAATRRDADLTRAEADQTGWARVWSDLAAATWLGRDAEPASAPAVLDLIEDLDRHVTAHDSLLHRITAMEDDRAALIQALAGLAPATDLTAPAEAWTALTRRVATARMAEEKRSDLTDAREKLQHRLAGLHRQTATTDARIADMAGHYGVTGLNALQETHARALRRTDLARTCSQIATDLADRLAESDPARARTLLDATDRSATELEAEQLGLACARLNAEVQEAYAALSTARQALAAIGGDDAVARIETRRQALLLQIAAEAEGHLRTRFGLIVTDHALRRYRETHRSAMLDRASRAFAGITRGAYSGLAAQPDREREQLVALAAGGGSKLAQDLSKGTRFQLYLALRVAAYLEYARTHPPVPFIADDILETFDDDRAAQTIDTLAEMARTGQVIYLTHHRHLCTIAAARCPGVRVQNLG